MKAPLVAALAASLAAGTLHAQSIQGIIVDETEKRPLAAVQVVLYDLEGTQHAEAISDEEGRFSLALPDPGEWIVSAELIGYGTLRSDPLDVELGEEVNVEIRMAVEAVALEPLVVTGRVSHISGDIRQFYERMERGRHSGFGTFVSRQEIEQRGTFRATDLFRGTASVRIVPGRPGRGAGLRMAGGCVPAIFIDGSHINRFSYLDSLDDYVSVHSIEGIEIYRGAGAQVERYHDPRGCGLILVWTRRGVPDPDGEPFSWKKLAIGVGLFGLLFLLQ